MMDNNLLDDKLVSNIVRNILENAHNYRWSLQGLGMLRYYISPEYRLHVWTENPKYVVKNVSTIHNHPWDFTSKVISGNIDNFIYESVPINEYGKLFNMRLIVCGTGGCAMGNSQLIRLRKKTHFGNCISKGQWYEQKAEEIHESKPQDGTVSLIRRKFRPDNTENALVFYPAGEEWVSAEPRPATTDEVNSIVKVALDKWNVC